MFSVISTNINTANSNYLIYPNPTSDFVYLSVQMEIQRLWFTTFVSNYQPMRKR